MSDQSEPRAPKDGALRTGALQSGALQASQPISVSPLLMWGPLVLVVALIAALLTWVATTSPDTVAAPPATSAPEVGPESTAEVRELPPGVETYLRAKATGIEDTIDWGDRCETETGKLKIPQWPRPDCFAPFEGDNGGSTAMGVTASEIKVVLYQSQPNDPVLKFIYQQIGSTDTIDDIYATHEGFVEIFNRYYELYGRKVVIERYIATGSISDATAATADAETIARDLKPFAVIGGPTLTSAFAETLSANQVMCIACTPGQPSQWYVDRAPYVWDVQRTVDQSLFSLANYIGRKLAGEPAAFAGDPAMRGTERVFGLIRVQNSANAQELEDGFRKQLRDEYGVEFAAIQTYGLPTDLAGSGKDIITAMKEAGVTSIVLSTDPLGPQTLTRVATEQNYFPEWVMGVSTLVDTTVFSQTYDQRQWAHAFGQSGLFARVPPDKAGAGYVYRWYFGEPAAAEATVALIAGPWQVLYGALQGAGPDLTHELFGRILFGSPITKSTPISAQVSFGNRGVFPAPDYAALDDATEIWWDPDAESVTEIGTTGQGAWRYVDGGKRFLPDEWPEGQPDVFNPDTAITGYDDVPPGVNLPTFPPLRR